MKTNQKSNANLRTFYIRHACIAVGCYPVSGVILQLTLMGRGVSAAQIAAITSTMSAVQMAMILFSSLLADRVRSVRRISALCVGGMSVFALCVLPFAGRTDMDAAAIAGIYLAAGCAYQLIGGLYTVLEYKLPYQIIDMRDYGRVTSIQGLVNGVLLIGVSSLCMAFIARWGIGRVSIGLYGISAAAYLAAGALTLRLRECARPQPEKKEEKAGLMETLRLPAFRWLLAPNVMRGFNSGVLGMAAVVGMHALGLSETQSSALSVAYTVMSLAGCAAYLLLLKRFSSHQLYLAGSVIMLLMLPASVAGRRFSVFLICYIVAIGGQMLCDYAAPVTTAQIVPYRCIGSYTSLRMGAHTGGAALGTLAAGLWLAHLPAMGLLALSGGMQLASGLGYYLFCRRHPELFAQNA